MDGLILPDVPFEEKEEFDTVCKKYGIDLISLIAPTSHERIAQIAKDAEGFVYCVSSLGVTGTRTNITTDIGAMVKLVKQAKDIPCAVGFGISTPEQAKKMAAQSDGAIVGSAIVKLCAQYGRDCVPYVKEYVKSMKDAVMEAQELKRDAQKHISFRVHLQESQNFLADKNMRYKKNDPLSEPQHAASLGHFSYVFSIFLATQKFLGSETAHEMKYVSALCIGMN